MVADRCRSKYPSSDRKLKEYACIPPLAAYAVCANKKKTKEKKGKVSASNRTVHLLLLLLHMTLQPA